MIFSTNVNGTRCQCHVMGSTDQKLYYRLLDKNGRPALWLKRLQTPQTDQQLQREYQATIAVVYYGAS